MLFWTAVFLLLCQAIQEWECESFEEDDVDIINRTDPYDEPADFRCLRFALVGDFDFDEHFNSIGYAIVTDERIKQLGCTAFAKPKYPRLTGTDPMMPYYINNLHRGIPLVKDSDTFMASMTPLGRTKEYCASIEVKMVDIITMCYEFLQMRAMYVAKLYDKLCLSEDACYNVMDYYEEDLPFCVKYTAINEFKNFSVGSWHHSIINYCKLTEMVPETKAENYDRSILTQNGRTKEKLRDMCLYLRYRVLPEEGKEQEISEDAIDKAEYDVLDTETTTGTEYENGASITLAIGIGWWNTISLIIDYL